MKLSIIIPCYNAENYITRCVDSILTQESHKLEIEILLCNDGSKDNTLEILHLLQEKYPAIIRIDNHENMGVYKTRNRALEIINGDYVWLIDADDSIKPNALQYIEKKLNDDPEVLTFGYEIENQNKSFTYIYPPQIKYPTAGLEYLYHNDGRLFLWCNIYKKYFIDKHELKFLGKSMSLEDSFFNIQVFTHAQKVNALQKVIYRYHFNENSISKKPTLENRLRQGESSVNVHLSLKSFRDSFKNETLEYQVINTKLKHSILGFFFSLLVQKYPIDYVHKIFALYTKKGLFPIASDKNLNKKAKAFRLIANNKHFFILLSKINLMRK